MNKSETVEYEGLKGRSVVGRYYRLIAYNLKLFLLEKPFASYNNNI